MIVHTPIEIRKVFGRISELKPKRVQVIAN
jgi:hypothetical protein